MPAITLEVVLAPAPETGARALTASTTIERVVGIQLRLLCKLRQLISFSFDNGVFDVLGRRWDKQRE
jgi:hypothetical protein